MILFLVASTQLFASEHETNGNATWRADTWKKVDKLDEKIHEIRSPNGEMRIVRVDDQYIVVIEYIETKLFVDQSCTLSLGVSGINESFEFNAWSTGLIRKSAKTEPKTLLELEPLFTQMIEGEDLEVVNMCASKTQTHTIKLRGFKEALNWLKDR